MLLDNDPIYLDYASSTPCERVVMDEMQPFFMRDFGNPSNTSHVMGRRALEATEEARRRAASLLGTLPHEIVWTSGATESNNLALQGVARGFRATHHRASYHIITDILEHKSVLDPVRALESDGFDVTYLRPNSDGVITMASVADAINTNTFLVSVMWANNELGTINEIETIGALCRSRSILFHCDGTQWVGKCPTRDTSSVVDLLSWSSHKIYGPKGVGALFIRNDSLRFRIEPLLMGGGQERGIRSGTTNVPGVVGFGKACEIAIGMMADDAERLQILRDRIEQAILAQVPRTTVNGAGARRLPHISSMTFALPTLRGNFVEQLAGIACSAGAACGTRDIAPSHVLRGLSMRTEAIRGTIRLSLGRPTTEAQVGSAISEIARVAAQFAT